MNVTYYDVKYIQGDDIVLFITWPRQSSVGDFSSLRLRNGGYSACVHGLGGFNDNIQTQSAHVGAMRPTPRRLQGMGGRGIWFSPSEV